MPANDELAEFLRSRRARLSPEDLGLPGGGRRRVPGLRREEVAITAGVSTDYYVRLEQGRDLTPSDSVVDAIARALRLDVVEREHLRALAHRSPAPGRTAHRGAAVRPSVRILLDSLDIPAMALGRGTRVLAQNRMSKALATDYSALPSAQRYSVRWMFLDPRTREYFVDWEVVARHMVAVLRGDADRHPDDADVQALVGELSVASPEFRTWWARHDIATYGNGSKRLRHPVVGELELHREALRLEDEDQWLYLSFAEPGSPSEESLRLLGSWALGEGEQAATALGVPPGL